MVQSPKKWKSSAHVCLGAAAAAAAVTLAGGAGTGSVSEQCRADHAASMAAWQRRVALPGAGRRDLEACLNGHGAPQLEADYIEAATFQFQAKASATFQPFAYVTQCLCDDRQG
jgi:hypothetical protein